MSDRNPNFAAEISITEFLLHSFFEDGQQSKTEHGSGHEMKFAYLYHRASARGHFNTNNKIMKKVLNSNTHLCVDVKTFLRNERIAKLNKQYTGVLTRDAEEHFTFVETPSLTDGRRNPRVYEGKCITVTLWADGSLHPNFKQKVFGRDFCCEAAKELLSLADGLVER